MEKVLCCERIKEAMSIRNFRQVDLVDRTGLSSSKINHYCTGRYVPKQDATYLLAKALNVDEAWLMGYDVPMEKPSEIIFNKIEKLDRDDLLKLEGYIDQLLSNEKYAEKNNSAAV